MTNSKVIRLFVSSTFSDFHIEREILQRSVFPRIRDFCQGRGFRFQPIDLRWGVNEEASANQRTMRICLEEIQRCQQISPDFNFLILLGDRYGSCLLPESIRSQDFHRLASAMDHTHRTLLEQWYREDLNLCPPSFVLLPHRMDTSVWKRMVEEPLHTAFFAACQAVGLSLEAALMYTGSATHQEIQAGLFEDKEHSEAVLCVFRSFATPPQGQAGSAYVEHDLSNRQRLSDLKDALHAELGERIAEYTARWGKRGPLLTRAMLEAFFYHLLLERVQAVIERRRAAETTDPVIVANSRFTDERTLHFTGRREAIHSIMNYLAGVGTQPFLVSGASGSGKSTLLAEMTKHAPRLYPQAVIVVRYIAITPGTTNLPSLLSSLREEISRRYHPDRTLEPVDGNSLIQHFSDNLRQATSKRPLILVIDALDQLDEATQRLDWLPMILPANVHVILSMLPDRPEFELLSGRISPKNVLMLDSMRIDEGSQLLDRWLSSSQRTIQPTQRDALLSAFAVEGRPLFLRLAYEEARQWHSFTPIPRLPTTIPDILDNLFERTSRNHGSIFVGHSMGNLAVAKRGLAENEILDVLASDRTIRTEFRRLAPGSPPIDPHLPLPMVLWAQLFADLEPYLTVRDFEGSQLITFYHQLAEVIRTRYLQDQGLARHQSLAQYFNVQPLFLAELHLLNARKVDELVYQQMHGAMLSDLQDTLTDVAFLEQKIARHDLTEVLDGLAALPDIPDIRRLAFGLRTSNHILDSKPDELENQIMGRVGDIPLLHNRLVASRLPRFRLLEKTLLPADSALLLAFQTGAGSARCCAFSPDGQWLLCAPDDHSLRMYARHSGQLLRIFQGHTENVADCVFSPDGRFVLSASYDKTLRLWEADTGKTLQIYKGHRSWVISCAFNADGSLILSTSFDQTMRLWKTNSGRCVRIFTGHEKSVNDCAFSPDEKYALSASLDQTLRLWSLSTGKTIRIFSGHAAGLQVCAFSPDGRYIASGAGEYDQYGIKKDTSVRLWEVSTGKLIHIFDERRGINTGCIFSSDGCYLISASTNSPYMDLQMYDVESRQPVRSFQGHTALSTGCALSKDNRYLASASSDGTVRVWDLSIRSPSPGTLPHTENVQSCAFSPDGRFATSAASDVALRLWATETKQTIHIFPHPENRGAKCCAFSPDSRYVVSGSFDGLVRLWDIATLQLVRVFKGHSGIITRCVFSPDGKYIVSSSFDKTLRLWKTKSGRLRFAFTGHTDTVVGCAYSPNSRYILSTSSDSIRLWETENGQQLRLYQNHLGLGMCVFSPDGQFILGACKDAMLMIWEPLTGKEHQTLKGHRERVNDCAFSSDGRYALSCSGDGTARLWDVASGKELTQWLTDTHLSSCAFHPHGDLVLVGDSNGGVHYLELEWPH